MSNTTGLRGPVTHIVLALLLLVIPTLGIAQATNAKDLIKTADKYFEKEKYNEALSLYSQLVANFPKDPNYNFKYGACLLFADENKSKGMQYLEYAVSRPDVDAEAFFFLGKGYHLNYSFAKALKNYEKYKGLAKTKMIAKYDVDGHLRQAKNGKSLLKNLTDIVVLQKQKLKEADYFKVYDLSEFGGKLVLKPEEFKTSYEKEAGIESVLYLPQNASRIYFSSIDSEEGDRDLYYADRTPKGWSAKKKLPSIINTEFDEDFAFVHPEANVLYFSSKGHNSLGGYDIFKSEFYSSTGNWSKPENMDFSINTPDDDFLFITDKEQKKAYFSSKRSSVQGEVHVYRINMQRIPPDIAVISGIFESNTTKSATIQVKDIARNVIIGEYQTDPGTGKYLIQLPQTGNFQFLVDYKGSEVAHAGEVSLKNQDPLKPLLQEMKIENQGTVDEKLIIKNLIDVQVEDDDPIIAEIFKQRAQLNVTSQEKIEQAEKQALVEGPKAAVSTKAKEEGASQEEGQSGQSSETASADKPKDPKFDLIGEDYTKEDIVKVAMNNAMSLEKDAKILEKEAQIATAVAAEKRQKAKLKRDEVALAYSKLDTTVKTTATADELSRIRYMEREAEYLQEEARVSDELAEDLKDRAYQKKSGMAIAMSYANQIQNSIDDNNKESSLQKFNQLKEYVEEQKQEKSSINTMGESIDAQLKQKRAVLRNQKRYQKRLEDQLFEKEKRYMEMNPDPENPDESAKKLAEELKRDRINVERVKARTERTVREVETLRSEIEVVKQIADEVNTSKEIAALASETPDAQVVPEEISVPDISEDLKEASESDLSLTAEEKASGIDESDLANISEDGEVPAAQTERPSNEQAESQDQRPQSLNALKTEEHTDYSKPSGGRFHPETINAKLADPENQSLAILMRSGYNNAYQEDFLAVAEEQDDLVRTAKMKVLNEDWIEDIQAEYDYLDSLERTNTLPENTEAIEERKSSLRKLLNVKKKQLNSVNSSLNSMAAERGENPDSLVTQIREGKAVEFAKYQEEQAQIAEEQRAAAEAQTQTDETQLADEGQNPTDQSQTNTDIAASNDQSAEGSDQSLENTEQASNVNEPASTEESQSEPGNEVAQYNSQSQSEETQGSTDNQAEQSEGGDPIAATGSEDEPVFETVDVDQVNQPSASSETEGDQNTPTEASAGVGSRQAQAQVKDPEAVKELVLEGDEEAIVQRVNPAERFVSSETTKAELQTKVQPVQKLTQDRVNEKKREINDTQDEITQLESDISNVKGLFKKKKREPLEQELKFKQQEAAMLNTQLDKIEKESDAVVELSAVDIYDQGSASALSPREMASMNAQELKQMAADTAKYAEDLRSLAENTKKKKEKARLLKQAEVYDERAKKLEAEATKTEELAIQLESVENQVASIRENTKLELPEVQAEISPQQSAEIKSSPEFIKYNTERSEGERKIKRAEVLYQQALKLDLDANMKEAEAEELETQIEASTDPEEKKIKQARVVELRKEVQTLRADAGSKKKEAHQIAVEGNKQRNAAIASVMSLDVSQREAIAAVEQGRKPGLEGKSSFTPEEFSDIVQGKLEIPDVLTTAIYKKVEFNESLYNESNPIPVNSKVPKGLVYMVQVGAFRLPISQDVFKGFAPVRGESAPAGLTRYMAGLFKKINAANLAKNEIRAIGYSDAFVVAYFNGERITLSQAREMEGAGPALADEVQISPDAPAASSGPDGSTAPAKVFKADEIKGLYYTVQVGAFSREVPPSAMYNLSPLVSRQVSGLVKYTCGIYSSRQEAEVAKDKIRTIGISDAFVTIFHNGQPISGEQAQQIIDEQGDAAFASDVPVSTGSSGGGGGAATGVEYQVQVGAYAEEVPVKDAQIILSLSNLGIDVKSDGGMTKYVVGGYKSYREANEFKNKVIEQGLGSAFIVAYQNGQKIDIAQAKELTGD